MATTIDGDSGTNLLDGGDGRDRLRGFDGNDTLNGGLGRDTLMGGGGNDTLNPSADMDVDYVYGGSGDDYVYFGSPGDQLDGGTGYDTLLLSFPVAGPIIEDLRGVKSGGTYTFADGTMFTNFENVGLYLSGGDDVVYAARFSLSLTGYGGNDKLIGNGLNNNLDGSAYATGDKDTLLGGDGDDGLSGGPGDILNGGRGSDNMSLTLTSVATSWVVDLTKMAAGGKTVLADGTRLISLERGSIYLGGGNDYVDTSDLAITVDGGAGNDHLISGGGPSYFTGGPGDDTIEGGGGVDWVSYTNAPTWVTIDLRIHTAQDTGGAGLDTLTGIEVVVGTYSFADTLTGDGGANTLLASGGNDYLNGAGGNDSLNGGFTVDADTLDGGLGKDTLTGSLGADTFVFSNILHSAMEAPDLITDLTNEDVIDLHVIDADTVTGGNQAFALVNAVNTGRGEMRLTFEVDATFLLLYVNGDASADAMIKISGDHTTFTNFVA
ncbi:MAG: calcium-binding protein [Caulobacteraceae bacterium]